MICITRQGNQIAPNGKPMLNKGTSPINYDFYANLRHISSSYLITCDEQSPGPTLSDCVLPIHLLERKRDGRKGREKKGGEER